MSCNGEPYLRAVAKTPIDKSKTLIGIAHLHQGLAPMPYTGGRYAGNVDGFVLSTKGITNYQLSRPC
jgi:hypothetical protein